MATFTSNAGRPNCTEEPRLEIETQGRVSFTHVTCAACGLDYRVTRDGA